MRQLETATQETAHSCSPEAEGSHGLRWQSEDRIYYAQFDHFDALTKLPPLFEIRFALSKWFWLAQLHPLASMHWHWERCMTVSQGRMAGDAWVGWEPVGSVCWGALYTENQICPTHRGFPKTSVAPELGVAMWAPALWCHSPSLLWPPSHTYTQPLYRFVSSTQLCFRMV